MACLINVVLKSVLDVLHSSGKGKHNIGIVNKYKEKTVLVEKSETLISRIDIEWLLLLLFFFFFLMHVVKDKQLQILCRWNFV